VPGPPDHDGVPTFTDVTTAFDGMLLMSKRAFQVFSSQCSSESQHPNNSSEK